MTNDNFASARDSLIAPARLAFSITPDDGNDLVQCTKAIYVGTGGDIVVCPVGSENEVTFVNVQGGSILDVRCRSIRATGTTAADIVGLA